MRPGDVAPALAARTVDVVVSRSTAPAPAPGLDVTELPPTPAALFVPTGHRLAGETEVDLGAVDGERLLTWSAPGTPYTDMLLARCARAGARVTPIETAVTGGTGLVELVALGAVALIPAPWPPMAGAVRVALLDNVTLPLVAVRRAGPPPPVVARLLEALRAA